MTDAEREAQIRERAKGHSYLTDNEFLLLRLLDEARAEIARLTDAANTEAFLDNVDAALATRTTPPGASVMERAFQIIRAVEFHLMRSDDEESGYPEGSKVVARAIEQAKRDARAEYVETSRKLRAEAVSAAKAETRAAALEEAAQAVEREDIWGPRQAARVIRALATNNKTPAG